MGWPQAVTITDPFRSNMALSIRGNGTTAVDISPNAMSLTVGAGVLQDGSQFLGGLKFPGGAGSVVSVAASPLLALGPEWCIEGYIAWSPNNAYQAIFDCRTASTQGFAFYVDAIGRFTYTNNNDALSFSGLSLVSTVPYYWALERYNGVVSCYCNGMLASAVADARSFGAELPFFLGQNYAGTQQLVNTVLADVTVTKAAKYKKAFTPPPQMFFAGGAGYLSGEYPGGTTTVEGVPTEADVRVLYRNPASAVDGVVLARATSAAAGTWQITGLNPDLRYDVVGRKDGFNDVIVSNVQPVV